MWTSWPFIAVTVLFFVLAVVFISYDFTHEYFLRKTFKKRFGLSLFRIAKNHDWLLVNKVTLLSPIDQKKATIDAVLFGDKYVYQIAFREYPGAVTGDGTDAQWLILRRSDSLMVTNPLLAGETRKHVLASVLQIDPSNVINVVVIAKNSLLDDIKTSSAYQLVVSERDFIKAIEYVESSSQIPTYLDETVETYAARLQQLSQAYRQ